jgi:preprotein translocase subunit SecF
MANNTLLVVLTVAVGLNTLLSFLLALSGRNKEVGFMKVLLVGAVSGALSALLVVWLSKPKNTERIS